MFDQSSPYFEIFLTSGQTITLNGVATKHIGRTGSVIDYNFDTREGVEILKIETDMIVGLVQHY